MKKLFKLKQKIALELTLLSRLKVLGIITCFFALFFLVYALKAPVIERALDTLTTPEEELSGLSTQAISYYSFNFYSIASLFGAIGITCIILSWKKTRSIRSKKK